MPDPLQPTYGTNLRALIPKVDTEQLRRTIEREVRQTLNELAPGVNPGIIFDILVDVTMAGQEAAQVQLDMTAYQHTIAVVPPEPSTETRTYSNWSTARNPDTFATEYQAEFMPSNGFDELQRHHDDLVDSMHAAVMGIDRAQGRDRTGMMAALLTDPPYGEIDINEIRVPGIPLQTNPTVTLDEIRNRRFDLINRRPAQRPNPLIAALVRAKLNPPKPPSYKATGARRPVPQGDENLTRWERIRANYTLFE
jgi:hypothetical protein